jgi:hypothetical protein
MLREKISAAARSTSALVRAKKTPRVATLLAPWHLRATANARRLRRK